MTRDLKPTPSVDILRRMDQRLLVFFPARLLDRAKREIASPESGIDNLNQLVTEALTQYLDALDSANVIAERSPQPRQDRLAEELFVDRLPIESSEPQQTAASSESRMRNRSLDRRPTEPEAEVDEGLIPIEDLEPPVGAVFNREISRARELVDLCQPLVLANRGRFSPETVAEAARMRQRILGLTEIAPVQVNVFRASGDVAEPDRGQPLFGLHNRDYPSIWALRLLAEATSEGPVLWSEFASGLELTARALGEALRLLDQMKIPGESRRPGLRYATAFPNPGKARKSLGQWIPTNREDRKVRLHPFVKNNVARIQGGGHTFGGPEARGPLARWGAVAFDQSGRDYTLGVTSAGFELLGLTEGLSLELPHRADHAERFLRYLCENSPGDAAGFLKVMKVIGDSSPGRDDLIRANKAFFEGFLEKPGREQDLRYAGTMTQGYVARGREWGLIDPDQKLADDGKRKLYELTKLGGDLLPDLLDRAPLMA